MNTFNMKQWFQKNKTGPYRATLLTEDLDQENSQDGGMENEAEMGEQTGNPSMNPVQPADSKLQTYLNTLQTHDWHHDKSDDHNAWQRGKKEIADLKALYSQMTPEEKQTALDAYVEAFEKIYPESQFPGAEGMVKFLTTSSFEGAL